MARIELGKGGNGFEKEEGKREKTKESRGGIVRTLCDGRCGRRCVDDA
jgi:hypothetical protein